MKKFVITLTLFFFSVHIAIAAPLHQTEDPHVYTVQAGDTLSKIATKFYGNSSKWTAIVDATNAKAKEDNSFAAITNPNVIKVGQKLWIAEGTAPSQTPVPGVTQAPAPNATQAPAPSASPAPSSAAELQQEYLNAVKDAAIVEPQEISRDLIGIVESEQRLMWQGEPGHKQLLVLTWTSWNGYDDKVGQAITTTRETWITTVPQLKDFCTHYNTPISDALTLRLEQLLGLPPNNGKTKFIEMWAKPQDMFRPSPDPEITDHEADLDFPTSKYLTISAAHIAWFNDLKSKSYGEKGFPWTRLGYSYDWGNPKSAVGLSEFVISAGAAINVRSVTSTADYCRR